MLPDLDPSVYSKIEVGKQELRIGDLKTIMNTLSLTTEEAFSGTILEKEQKKYLTLFYYCSRNLHNETKKTELLAYYNELKNKEKNLRELSNYLAIKNHFSYFWKELDKITDEEIDKVYKMLVKKSYFQHYDYAIIRNLVRFLIKNKLIY